MNVDNLMVDTSFLVASHQFRERYTITNSENSTDVSNESGKNLSFDLDSKVCPMYVNEEVLRGLLLNIHRFEHDMLLDMKCQQLVLICTPTESTQVSPCWLPLSLSLSLVIFL